MRWRREDRRGEADRPCQSGRLGYSRHYFCSRGRGGGTLEKPQVTKGRDCWGYWGCRGHLKCWGWYPQLLLEVWCQSQSCHIQSIPGTELKFNFCEWEEKVLPWRWYSKNHLSRYNRYNIERSDIHPTVQLSNLYKTYRQKRCQYY